MAGALRHARRGVGGVALAALHGAFDVLDIAIADGMPRATRSRGPRVFVVVEDAVALVVRQSAPPPLLGRVARAFVRDPRRPRRGRGSAHQIAALVAWLRAHGVDFTDRAAFCRVRGMGVGGVATRDFAQGDVIFSLPLRAPVSTADPRAPRR